MFLELKINELISSKKTISVALIGAGKFGSMFLSQVPSTKGLNVSVICEIILPVFFVVSVALVSQIK